MIQLFHGSNVAVRKPKILRSDRLLDFGTGFYLTSSFEQASKWARLTTKRRQTGTPSVTVYDFDEAALEQLRILKFDSASPEWLGYISDNRQGLAAPGDFDIVIGPVANDATMPVLRGFFANFYTVEETIRRLLPQNLKDQYAFKTQEAVDALVFFEVIGV